MMKLIGQRETTMSNDRRAWSPISIVLGLLSFILALMALDLASDYRAGTTLTHSAIELLVMGFCTVGVIVLWREYRAQRELVVLLRRDVTAVREEAARWQADARRLIDDLAAAVDRQLAEWSLTGAERDIAFALLRGLSHKEIAVQRKTSERTVREQARTVYQKAGVEGRSGLAAFFLWNLSPPDAPEPSGQAHA